MIEKPTFKDIILLNIQNLTNFPYIEKDFDSLTDYGLLCKVVDKMNEVITNNNIQNDSINDLYDAFLTLKNYVDNYFDNLDVQDEINNKLDEMAEDGSLTLLLSRYVDPIINEFKNDVNQDINRIETKVDAIVDKNPIPVDSVDDMTDTEQIYLLTTNGEWYYYNGTSFISGGTYQSMYVENKSITYAKISDDLSKILEVNTTLIENNWLYHGSWGSISNINGYVDYGTVSNHTRIRCQRLPVKNGDIIKFNNSNDLYKYGLFITDENNYILAQSSLGNYSHDIDTYIVNTTNDVKYLNYVIAYSDNTKIESSDVGTLYNLITVYTHKALPRIVNNSIGYSKLPNVINSDNILNMKFLPIAFGNTNNALVYHIDGVYPKSLILEIEENETYYIKVYGDHDRFRLIGLYEYPVFENEYIGNLGLYVQDENIITINDTLDSYILVNNNFKYLLINVATDGPLFPQVSVSKNELTNYKEFNMALPNLNCEIFNNLSRSVFFTETEYASTCEMQGCCTDGIYLYFGMHDLNDTDNGVIGKIDLSTGSLVSEVKNHSYGHVNGMCYYNNKLYIASASDPTNTPSRIYVVNTNDLSYNTEFDLESKVKTPWENISYGTYTGIGAIGYSDELNKFVCLIRKNATGKRFRGFAIFDNNFNLEKLIKIDPDNTPETYPTTVGGLDADDKYIYLTMTKNIPDNFSDVIHIYDYNANLIAEKILPQNPRDFIEGIAIINNVIYTSNASDKICKYVIKTKENVPIGNVLLNYNAN